MFTFRQFAVDDSRSAMKVGTDGVVLGAWTGLPSDKPIRILDAGCGSGLISLMIAQRFPLARIIGVDTDGEACADASDNFARSPWSDRLSVVNASLFDMGDDEKYDAIICNPPFFTESLRSPGAERAAARHEGSLGVGSLIEFAARHLSAQGTLSFIAPAKRNSEIDFLLTKTRLTPRRRTEMRQRPGRPFVRTLWQASRDDGPIVKTDLTICAPDGRYSPGFHALTDAFYLPNPLR